MKLPTFVCIALCAAAAWASPQQPAGAKGSAEARAEFDKGAAALRQSDWDGAVEHYGKAAQLDPEFYEAHEQYVFVSTAGPKNYNNEKLHRELEAHYLAAAKEHPDKPVYRYCLGMINQYKQPDLAVRYFQEAVEIDPKFAPAWDMLGTTAEAQGKLAEEREYYRKAADAWPENSRYGRHAADAWMMAEFPLFWKASMEHIARHPEDAANQLTYMASRAPAYEDTKATLELIYQKYMPQGASSLSLLFHMYMREDAAKALKLATAVSAAAPQDRQWPPLAAYAQAVMDARTMLAAGKTSDALSLLAKVTLPPRSDHRMLDVTKAAARAAAGEAEGAYADLLKIFAEKPNDEVGAALLDIGKRLAKDSKQVDEQVLEARSKAARPGIPFHTVTYPDNRPIKLSDYSGKVFLLNFWYPMCGPCRGEFPTLRAVLEKYRSRGFEIVAINVHPNEDAWVMPLMKGWNLGFLPIHGGEELMQAYNVKGAPSNFLYGPDGRIYYVPGPVNTVDARRELELQIEALLAQTQPSKTIAQCVAEIDKLSRDGYGRKPEIAGGCLDRFPMASVHGPELLDLAKLYADAGRHGESRAAIDKRLAEPALTDTEKGEAFLAYITAAQRGPVAEENRPRSISAAAEVAPRIDRLGDGAAWQQYLVYRWLNSYYRGDTDENGKVFKAADRLMNLYPKLTDDERKNSEAAFGLYCAYENLAGVYSSRGDDERAKSILREGIAKLSASSFAKALQKGLLHYELVGQAAPVIEAPYWINAKPEGNRIGFAGKVTILEFTAHWCVPCKETYPALTRLNDRFSGKGVQFVLATALYGYFGKDRGLSPEKELAIDRNYYAEEFKLSMPIALASKSLDDANSQNYGVQSIPQIVVIDRAGKVRRFLLGLGPSEEKEISGIIEGLLQP
jgi:thiol-disulfide isomerase/thioredoxin